MKECMGELLKFSSERRRPKTSYEEGLFPNGPLAEGRLTKVTRKKPVLVQITHPRNLEHLQKFWAIAERVADNLPGFIDAATLVEQTKLKCGMVDSWTDWGGRLVIQTKSIAVENMDQKTFENFYDRAVWLWSDRLGVDVTTLKREGQRGAA